MKDETIDKIYDFLKMSYLKTQVIFSWCMILFGVTYAIRNIIGQGDFFYTVCYGVIGFVAYKMLLKTSLHELREYRKQLKEEQKQ